MEEQNSTEQKIIDAAEGVFLEEGFAGARMQKIADYAGINKAMLHYYFKSKDKLFELILRHKMQSFLPELTATLHDESIPFLDKLDRFIINYLSMLRKNPKIPLFIFTTMNRNPDFVKFIPHRFGTDVVKVMRAEMAAGRIKTVDAHQFLLALMGMCIFPFVARPMFTAVNDLTDAAYDHLIAERHVHVMQFVRAILMVDGL
jgi:TetR/AcrR family transcriptional regulator